MGRCLWEASVQNRFKIILFNVEKDNNVGMITRSAYAFGCDELLIVGRQKVKTTGAQGTFNALRRRHFFQLEEAVHDCRAQGFVICGLEIGGTYLAETAFDQPTAFILGNEGRGLADAARFCEKIVSIPQWGGVPSLNVSVAAGILMYEFQSRQKIPLATCEGTRYFDDTFPLT